MLSQVNFGHKLTCRQLDLLVVKAKRNETYNNEFVVI